MPCTCRQFELGRIKPLLEASFDRGGTSSPCPFVAYAKFCAPKDILNSAWSDIVACSIIAGKTVGIRTIISNPAAVLGIFESTFKSCLVARLGGHADRIQVSLGTRQLSDKD